MAIVMLGIPLNQPVSRVQGGKWERAGGTATPRPISIRGLRSAQHFRTESETLFCQP
jgi:hypothetical protein